MHKLDLSLDIPGAPVVYRVRSEEPGVEMIPAPPPYEEDLWANEPSMAPATRPQAARFVSAGARHDVARSPLTADDLRVRQCVTEALNRAERTETSVVPAAATMSGDLVCHAIQIQGELSGSVSASGLVYVEANAVLNGHIKSAEMVILAGTVVVAPNELAIRCSGLVVLAQSARVIGHIQCRSIAIYDGARVVGAVQSFIS